MLASASSSAPVSFRSIDNNTELEITTDLDALTNRINVWVDHRTELASRLINGGSIQDSHFIPVAKINIVVFNPTSSRIAWGDFHHDGASIADFERFVQPRSNTVIALTIRGTRYGDLGRRGENNVVSICIEGSNLVLDHAWIRMSVFDSFREKGLIVAFASVLYTIQPIVVDETANPDAPHDVHIFVQRNSWREVHASLEIVELECRNPTLEQRRAKRWGIEEARICAGEIEEYKPTGTSRYVRHQFTAAMRTSAFELDDDYTVGQDESDDEENDDEENEDDDDEEENEDDDDDEDHDDEEEKDEDREPTNKRQRVYAMPVI